MWAVKVLFAAVLVAVVSGKPPADDSKGGENLVQLKTGDHELEPTDADASLEAHETCRQKRSCCKKKKKCKCKKKCKKKCEKKCDCGCDDCCGCCCG